MTHALLITFALLATSCASRPDMAWFERHTKAQKTGICEEHHVAMQHRTVRVTFGYPYYEGPWTRASRRFPNALEDVNGGCDPSIGPKTAKIYICPTCERLAREWALKHTNDIMAQQILEQVKRPNHAMQRTADRSAFTLPMTSTFNLQPHAPSPAVADLVSR